MNGQKIKKITVTRANPEYDFWYEVGSMGVTEIVDMSFAGDNYVSAYVIYGKEVDCKREVIAQLEGLPVVIEYSPIS